MIQKMSPTPAPIMKAFILWKWETPAFYILFWVFSTCSLRFLFVRMSPQTRRLPVMLTTDNTEMKSSCTSLDTSGGRGPQCSLYSVVLLTISDFWKGNVLGPPLHTHYISPGPLFGLFLIAPPPYLPNWKWKFNIQFNMYQKYLWWCCSYQEF